MKTRLVAGAAAVLVGAAVLLVPGTSQAGNVGYTPTCWNGDPSTLITAAGHTPVAVATPNAASLASLDALILASCGQMSANADINAAVNNGMRLIVEDWGPNAGTAAALPGTPAVTIVSQSGNNIELPAGSPIVSGPGGTLTSTSLDNHNSSYHGYANSPLPGGAVALLTTSDPAQVTAFAYGHGAGQVVYASMPVDASYPGADFGRTGGAGMRTFMTNAIALVMAGIGPSTTCASEGYTGTKLTWCKNICEMGYTGATLNMWIRRWVDRYHDLPYCAAEPQPALQ